MDNIPGFSALGPPRPYNDRAYRWVKDAEGAIQVVPSSLGIIGGAVNEAWAAAEVEYRRRTISETLGGEFTGWASTPGCDGFGAADAPAAPAVPDGPTHLTPLPVRALRHGWAELRLITQGNCP